MKIRDNNMSNVITSSSFETKDVVWGDNIFAVEQQPPKQEIVEQQPPKQEIVEQQPPKQEIVEQQPPKQEIVEQQPPKQEIVKMQTISKVVQIGLGRVLPVIATVVGFAMLGIGMGWPPVFIMFGVAVGMILLSSLISRILTWRIGEIDPCSRLSVPE